MELALVIVALILAAIVQVQSRGSNLTAWAVIALAVARLI